LAELADELAQAEKAYLIESSKYVQVGPSAPHDAKVRLSAARARLEAARSALRELEAQLGIDRGQR
jgi:hypothetical protein